MKFFTAVALQYHNNNNGITNLMIIPLTSPTAPAGTVMDRALCTREWRYLLLFLASFPPFSSRPFAVAIDRPATCMVELVKKKK